MASRECVVLSYVVEMKASLRRCDEITMANKILRVVVEYQEDKHRRIDY